MAEEAKKWKNQNDEIDSMIMALQAGTEGPEKKKVRIEEVSATMMVNTSALKNNLGQVKNKDSPEKE